MLSEFSKSSCSRFEEHELRLEYRHKEEVTIIASVPFDYNCDDTYVLKADIKGSHIICSVDDKVYFDLDTEYAAQGGKVAITATIPAQFGFVNVTTSESTAASIDAARNAYKAECEKAQAKYPKMKLLKKSTSKAVAQADNSVLDIFLAMVSTRWLWHSARNV